MSTLNRIKQERGFTIVELMVTLVITSLLILGAGGFLAAAHKSNTVQTAVSGLNASGRFGLDQVARDLRLAGYRDSDWISGAITNVLTGTDGSSASGGDTVSIRYEAARDCAFAAAPGGVATNVYRVVNGELECNGEPITGGVEEMQVYFGEDTTNDGVANRWMSPGTAGLSMSRVVTVRIHMLVVSDANDLSIGAQTYYFDNAVRTAADDGQIRREYSVTVALRNPV